jgi:hypothetical protein
MANQKGSLRSKLPSKTILKSLRSRSKRIQSFSKRPKKMGAEAVRGGRSSNTQVPFFLRGLRINRRVALAQQVSTAFTAKRHSKVAWSDLSERRLELIDWTMQKAQQLREQSVGLLSRESEPAKPETIETLAEVISSPARPTSRQSPPKAPVPSGIKKPPAIRRSLIGSQKLEFAITDAIKKGVPGCESFAGVFVQPTSPKSRFDANWSLRGVKFGGANRAKAAEAIAGIVERMQQEYKLSED